MAHVAAYIGDVLGLIAGSDDADDARSVCRLDGAIESRGDATAYNLLVSEVISSPYDAHMRRTQRQADGGHAGAALGGDVVDSPRVSVEHVSGCSLVPLEHLDSDDGRRLGNSVGRAADGASNVGAVADCVRGGPGDGTVAQAGAATEVGVGRVDAGVDDVGVGSRAGSAVVDVAARASTSLVGDGSQSPRRSTRLGGQGVEAPDLVSLDGSDLRTC